MLVGQVRARLKTDPARPMDNSNSACESALTSPEKLEEHRGKKLYRPKKLIQDTIID